MSGDSDRITHAVSRICNLTKQEFEEALVTPAKTDCKLPTNLSIIFETASSISKEDLMACFELIRESSSQAYKASSRGWSPRAKIAEMREPDMRYLLLCESSPLNFNGKQPTHGPILAFLSFMITVEDDISVVYCYEVHIKPQLRKQGLGDKLMRLMEAIGSAAHMAQAMLTVFTANRAAIRFYERLGYVTYDEEAVPSPKTLRTGQVLRVEPSFIIMAKVLH